MWCWWPAQIGPPQYTYEVVVSFVGETNIAGGQPKLVLLSTLTRLWCRYHLSQRCEPVDLPLPLSQTKCIWSLAPVEADVHSATHDMVA